MSLSISRTLLMRDIQMYIDSISSVRMIEVAQHHSAWWQTVALNYLTKKYKDTPSKWEQRRFYTDKNYHEWNDVRTLTNLNEDFDTPEVLYIMLWMEKRFPNPRDLSMVSYPDAVRMSREFCGERIRGDIIFTDTRLVTTYTAQDRVGNRKQFDIRQILTVDCAQHVGDCLSNCLRRSNLYSYFFTHRVGVDSAVKMMFALCETGTANVVATFHEEDRVTDSVNKHRYVLAKKPLTIKNAEWLFNLPPSFNHNGATIIGDNDTYRSVLSAVASRNRRATESSILWDRFQSIGGGGFHHGELSSFGSGIGRGSPMSMYSMMLGERLERAYVARLHDATAGRSADPTAPENTG